MLNPESITILDPACGSGHILVEAYDLMKAIYLEAGYRLRDIPRLILEKNLYGLDIDERAAQMAGFALLMKARADDRRILENPPRLNVLAVRGARGEGLGVSGEDYEVLRPFFSAEAFAAIPLLLETFAEAKTFGSLIQIPASLDAALPGMVEGLRKAAESGDVFAQPMAEELLPLVWQAGILGMKFDAVVANPPYMGGKALNEMIKYFAEANFQSTKNDVFAMFMHRGFFFAKKSGSCSMVTMQSWMFLSSFEKFRSEILNKRTIRNLFHLPYEGKSPTAMGINFGVSAFTIINSKINGNISHFCYANYSDLNEDGIPKKFPPVNKRLGYSRGDDFYKLPGSPIAYWANENVRNVFSKGVRLGDIFFSEGPCKTGNDELYMRYWWEVMIESIGPDRDWCLCSKGGGYRKYYGNMENIIKWNNEARLHYRKDKIARISPSYVWDNDGITWTIVTSKSESSFRFLPAGTKFNSVSPSVFPKNSTNADVIEILSLLNSKAVDLLLGCLNPTLALNVDNVLSIPVPDIKSEAKYNCLELIKLFHEDWDIFEQSIGFIKNNLIKIKENGFISRNWDLYSSNIKLRTAMAIKLEEENNRLFIEAYGLQDELSPEVPEDQITLARADREKDSQRLMSYAIGCMMGRYSLDEPGLIYAHAGNIGFDASRYPSFPADADGILPLTDEHWFEDDAAQRIREFLLAVWPEEGTREEGRGTSNNAFNSPLTPNPSSLSSNMAWLAESLGKKASETPDETLRRYLSDKFFKDHLQTYKKRPIYWLFSSGKQGAFQALVYLHRYHEGTLARMRNEYVIPLAGKIAGRIEFLEQEVANAPSTAARNKAQKNLDALRKKQAELAAYDEQLRHYADLRIALDLDDGVKVNYGKFGNLLAEVKAVTGGSADD